MTHFKAKNRIRRAALSTVSALALAGSALPWAVTPAAAAFPGYNGRIAFQSSRDGNQEVYVMDADGTNQTRLTNDLGADTRPEWQPIPNRVPVTANDTLTVSANAAASTDVLANDTDEEALSGSNLTITAAPTHGTATINDGTVSYTPAKDFVGSDQLTYQICDSFLLDQQCATGVLGITVTAAPVPPTPAATVSRPTITAIGTVQLHGATHVYYTGHRPTFSGTAEPGATVTVTIHSDPIVLTTTADSAGTWSVAPDQDIPNGEHQVIVTASINGSTSEALNLVLGINTGLAETGTPLRPVSAVGLLGLVGAREVLRRRAVKSLGFARG